MTSSPGSGSFDWRVEVVLISGESYMLTISKGLVLLLQYSREELTQDKGRKQSKYTEDDA